MNRIFALLIIFFLPVVSIGQDVTNLEAPVSNDESSCGAGFITLTATSSINNGNLEFEWYESTGGGLQFLGSLNGSTGRSQFITSFLIADKSFAVRVRLGNSVSPYTFVLAEILNEATITQRPEIQLCGEAYLDIETEMDSIESYQWQILVPSELGESSFEDLTTDSSDSTTLIAIETGFYRVIVTDSTGCQAISGEVEVSNSSVVDFIESVVHCYDPIIPGSDLVTLESSYGRSFTTYRWEESLDSVNFTLIATSQSVDVSKPTAQAYDTAFYRLTITEQNCSNDTTIAVYWRPLPEGAISHIDPLIGQNDFFYCGDDPVSDRTLQFSSTSLGISVTWVRVNHIASISQDSLKSYSGPNGPERLLLDFPLLLTGIELGDEVILTQNEDNLLPEEGGIPDDGGLVFAVVIDTVADNCGAVTNGIFADTAFPLPVVENALAYDYEANLDFIPVCRGEELVLTSYDKTADSYSWKQLYEDTDLFTEISVDDTLNILADQDYEGGTYVLEVIKNGCLDLSREFNVVPVTPPTVEISNIEEGEAFACDDIPSILLFGEGSEFVTSYQWLYSVDNENFVEAPGDSSNHFYIATLNGYYKLVASTAFCSSETPSVQVEIPDPIDPEFVLVAIEGDNQYCEGDEIILTCNYEGENPAYFWYYSFFQIDGDEASIELVELGETLGPEVTVDTRAFGSELTEELVLYFYILVIDGECIAGSTNVPFVVEINPRPNIEIAFSEVSISTEILVCDDEEVSEAVQVNNLSTVSLPNINYLWRKYNSASDNYDTLLGVSGTELTITEPGRYQCLAVDEAGSCFSISNDLDVLALPSEVIGDTLFCFGNDINLQASRQDLPDLDVFSYQWYYSVDGGSFAAISNEANSSLVIDPESELYGNGFFYYEVMYDACSGTSNILEVKENVNSFQASLSIERNQQKSVPFEVALNVTGIDEWEAVWEAEYLIFSDNNRAIYEVDEAFTADGLIVAVTILNPGGCEVELSEFVTFSELEEVQFPKFVSPNGDGLNDNFELKGVDRTIDNQLVILDNWGNRLYTSENFYNEPNQISILMNGLKAEGVYFYIFQTDNETIKGSFYLRK